MRISDRDELTTAGYVLEIVLMIVCTIVILPLLFIAQIVHHTATTMRNIVYKSKEEYYNYIYAWFTMECCL